MKILGLSGKKQSGKSTTANWIVGQQMVACDMVSWIKIDDKGRLVVPAAVNGEVVDGIFDPLTRNPQAQELLAHYVWPVVKLFSFADVLKQSAKDIFCLSEGQVNGTDEQKNQPTNLKWEHFEHVLSDRTRAHVVENDLWDDWVTGRNILQIMGTDMFRAIYNDVWVDACLNMVRQSDTDLAIITDCRFPNEVLGIQAAGGKVVRFLRAPFAGQDEHESEIALDDFPLERYDHVFDNRELSIGEQNEQTSNLLSAWGWNPYQWEEATE